MFRAGTFSREAASGMAGVSVTLCAPRPRVSASGIKDALFDTSRSRGKGGINRFTRQKCTTRRVTPPGGKAGETTSAASFCRSCVIRQPL